MKKQYKQIINMYAKAESEALRVLRDKKYDSLEVEERVELYASRRKRNKKVEEAYPNLHFEFRKISSQYELEGHVEAHKLIDRSLEVALFRHRI